MRENRFISQNKEKWLESETLLQSKTKDPDKLTTLFTQVVDDLAYSRTYFPNRSVRVYLNKIARQYFSIIYSHQPRRKGALRRFWFDTLPQVIIFCRKELTTSFLVFVGSMIIGILSAANDPEFTSTILGDSYVNMTKENIEKGTPMAVYQQSGEVEMFLSITVNNLLVAFRTYVLGVFMAVGTLALLLYNGVMVGCFQYFFVERGLFTESALTIWLHGTLEISSIILAGGAGLTLGKGLVFPGTYSRLQSFQISAMRSLKLMLGITPIFIIAGIIESFFTRYTGAPAIVKITVILISAAFIIGYFIIYPWVKSKRGFEEPLKEMRLSASQNEVVNYEKLKNNAEILKDTFQFYSRNIKSIFKWVVPLSLVQSIAIQYFRQNDIGTTYFENWFTQLMSVMFFAVRTEEPIFILVNSLPATLVVYLTYELLTSDYKKKKFTFDLKSLAQIEALILIAYALIYAAEAWGIVILIGLLPLIWMSAFTQHLERLNLGAALVQGWNNIRTNPGQVFELHGTILLLCFSFLIVLSAPLVLMYTSILEWNFALGNTWGETAISYVEVAIKVFSFNLIIPLLAVGTAYLYFTFREIQTAGHLKEAIEHMGVRTNKAHRR